MKLKTTISLILLTLFCSVSVFSQEVSRDASKATGLSKIPLLSGSSKKKTEFDSDYSENQCKKINENDFVGEKISINVVNVDVRDVLLYITEEYGFQFVIDKSIVTKTVTKNIINQPWNLVVKDILKLQGLEMVANCPLIRILSSETLLKEIVCSFTIRNVDGLPLYTEFIKLKNVHSSENRNNVKNQKNKSNQKIGLSKIVTKIQKRLTRRGSVEVDCRSNVLIITDVKENLNALEKLVGYLDEPEMYKLTEEEYKNDGFCNSSFRESYASSN